MSTNGPMDSPSGRMAAHAPPLPRNPHDSARLDPLIEFAFFGTHAGKVVAYSNESLAHLIPDVVSYEQDKNIGDGEPDMNVNDAASYIFTILGYEWCSRNKIRTIKMVREMGVPFHGLKEAKEAVGRLITIGFTHDVLRSADKIRAHMSHMDTMISKMQEIREILSAELDNVMQPGNGSVIMWTHRYPNSDKIYTFVAMRADNGKWYITGRDDHMTWAELCQTFPSVRNGQYEYMS